MHDISCGELRSGVVLENFGGKSRLRAEPGKWPDKNVTVMCGVCLSPVKSSSMIIVVRV